jgi:glycine/D-amino acid oxidase-like deaminating enzyme
VTYRILVVGAGSSGLATALGLQRSHLCTVTDDGHVIGLITLNDVLERLLKSGRPAA